MNSSQDIYEFVLDNIRKVMMPEELISIDLSVSKFELLALLLVQRQKYSTMGDLAQSMAVPMSTATGVTDRLVKKGLLARGSSTEDRRVVTVSLTAEGIALVVKFNDHFHNLIARVRNTVTDEEFKLMLELMRKVIHGLQKRQAKESNQQPAQPRRSITIE